MHGKIVRLATAFALLAEFGVTILGCKREANGNGKEAPVIIFRSADGRTLTLDDLRGENGTLRYEVFRGKSVPAEAESLHKQAREAGERGEYQLSINLLSRASEIAPDWPYPVYDKAYDYLLMEDYDAARVYYSQTVAMAPRGFFTAFTAVDILGRELRGEFPPGTYRQYVVLEWVEDRVKRTQLLQAMVDRMPRLAPAWKDLVGLVEDDAERLSAIEKGLAAEPDAETKGMLLINKAVLMDQQGDHKGAIRILGELAVDPKSTLATEHLAKMHLASLAEK